ncbi:hypothetical protein A7K94_0219570, partial [Modestobacter sp. VKM Ac-2676]
MLAVWASDPVSELAERLRRLPEAVAVEHLVLPVERDGRRFDYALAVARRAGGDLHLGRVRRPAGGAQ